MTRKQFYAVLYEKGVRDATQAKSFEQKWLSSGKSFDAEPIEAQAEIPASTKPAGAEKGYFGRMGERIESGIQEQAEKTVKSQETSKTGYNKAMSTVRGAAGSMNVILGNLPVVYEAGHLVGKGIGAAVKAVPEPVKGIAAKAGKALAERTPEEVKSTLGAALETAGLVGSVVGGVGLAAKAPGMAVTAAKGAAKLTGKTAVATGTAAKDAATTAGKGAVQTAKKVAGAFTPDLTPAEWAAKVKKDLQSGLMKGVRPSKSKLKSMGDIKRYQAKGARAVDLIDDYMPSLKVLDDAGEAVSTVSNRKQMLDALDQTKREVFKKYDAMQKAATGYGFDPQPVIDKLDEVAANTKRYDSAIRVHAKRMADEISHMKGATAEEVNERIKYYNSAMPGFEAGQNVGRVEAQVEGTVAAMLRGQLDDMVTKAVGPGYNKLKQDYSALRFLEDDIARQAASQLGDKGALGTFTNLISGERLISSVILSKRELLARAASMEGAGAFLKWYTGPDRHIKQMFQSVKNAKAAGVTVSNKEGVKAAIKAAPVAKVAPVAKPETVNLAIPTYQRRGMGRAVEQRAAKDAAERARRRASQSGSDISSWHRLGDLGL